VADLEGLRAIVQYLQVDLSAGHGAPISFAFCAYGIARRRTRAVSPISERVAEGQSFSNSLCQHSAISPQIIVSANC
jgi:hypothetical protein